MRIAKVVTRAAGAIALIAAAFGAVAMFAGWAVAQEGAKTAPVVTPLGVYRGANETEKVDEFGKWIGRPVWGEDFIGWESWSNVAWPTWWLEKWSTWKHAEPGRRFVFSVPLLAGPNDLSGPTQGQVGVGVPVSLDQAAAGEYDHHYKTLAENLVKHKLADSVLRLGWEFNGNWYPWQAKGKEKQFAEYWRRIVKTMRSVPGTEKLQFCWNPTLGMQQFPAELAWPGAEFVDFVGVDVYDESWQEGTYPWPETSTAQEIDARHRKVWEKEIHGGERGLVFWSDFAKKEGRPLAICEWGCKTRPTGHGGRDNAFFVEQMHKFINDPANHVAFHIYFDFNCPPPDGNHQLSPDQSGNAPVDFPQSSALFKKLFGGDAKTASQKR
ncbi:MAG TPA: glycosyl hydrolase [Pirellulales bacterium]